MLSSLCRVTLNKQLEQRTKDTTNEIRSTDLVTFARLEAAVKASDSVTLRKIVGAGRSVEYLTAEGSLLYHAVKCRAPLWFIEELLQLEANPNYFSYQDHQTALHLAAREGYVAALEVLLDYGGSPMEVDVAGQTVFEAAQASNHKNCIELLDRVMKLQRDLQLLELSTVSGICEKHRRLSTIAERSESAMPSIHNRTSMAAEVHDTKREDPYTTSFESYNGGASISSASIDTLNCAFCQEASLQASLLDASDLAATSPPSELYLSVRNPLGSIENSPEIGATPLRATRVRRRLADNISFRESLKNDSADDKPTDNDKTPVRDHVIENDLECKKVDLMSGLRGGLERVAAGILAYLSPEKKSPSRIEPTCTGKEHDLKNEPNKEAIDSKSDGQFKSDGEDTSFESAKTAASEESCGSAELENLNWTADVDQTRHPDVNVHDNDAGDLLASAKPTQQLVERGQNITRYSSSLFTDDITFDNPLSKRSVASSLRTPLPDNIQCLSDDELFQQLFTLGMNPGPINDATRSIYRHQLAHLRLGNDVRLAITPHGVESVLSDGTFRSAVAHGQHCRGEHDEGQINCCEVIHRDLESGLMLREEHYGTKRSQLPPNAIQASPSQAIPPELVKLSNDEVRQRLVDFGENPGPVNRQTRAVYLRQLHRLQQANVATPPPSQLRSVLPPELHMLCVKFGQVFEVYSNLESQMEESFLKQGQRWREGSAKTAFTYLLLDSSVTLNLPDRATHMSLPEQMETFVKAVFYVGKGKRSRPFAHLYEALDARDKLAVLGGNALATPQRFATAPKIGDKIKRILKIWGQGHGVISLHIFQNVIPVEAYTREAAMIEALGINRLLTNAKRGEFYGIADTWTTRQRKQLGAYLVYRAMQVFLAEGERRLGPLDL
ncbi:uncharacterized protein LOC111273810 isoform X1 [Varroa jacobsoni]|uniref:uncharacterized protein LOC111273810 isoform X1 n=1 Tax=Varroa jacobsoni TaxID=62625 RepID=UPI000BF4BDFE|nr:uncharacterized protein LOC111273810 isoform X1 [Varroa jacobsoni]